MLDHAGVNFEVVPADVDEARVKRRLGDPGALSIALGEAKALAVGGNRPDDWVIGSDSVVSVGGKLFDKPRDREEAANHLRFFSGKSMTLSSAVALARGSRIDWSVGDAAKLEVRPLSDAFISSYLDAEWPQVGHCVGVFRLEGPGVQLFDRIEGDYFTILGMPLLPLLSALRQRGVLSS